MVVHKDLFDERVDVRRRLVMLELQRSGVPTANPELVLMQSNSLCDVDQLNNYIRTG
jgi:hypothetical protein